jgi:hypothetical protein
MSNSLTVLTRKAAWYAPGGTIYRRTARPMAQ